MRGADHTRVRLLVKAGDRVPEQDLIGMAMSLLAVGVGIIAAIWFFFVHGPGPLVGVE